jgi:transcriptional regulator of acetoin/glycerol metabolism
MWQIITNLRMVFMSSHLAVISSEGLAGQRKLIETERYRFICNGQDYLQVRPIVHESWQRCLQSGVNPGRKQAEEPPQNANIQDIIACSKIYEHAKDILAELLSQTQDTKFLLTLCDAQGRIIYLSGNPQVRKQAEKMNFVLGSDWSEEAIGTNAIGTSLKTAAPVQIFSAEHFCEGVHDWICSASPIRDPLTKKIMGVIDFTGLWREAQAHTLGMTLMASKVIENKILYDLQQKTSTKRSLYIPNTNTNTNAHAYANANPNANPNPNSNADTHWDKIVGNARSLLTAINKSQRIAQANVPILLLGESGTGKELFAKAIHQSSDRQKGPFITINCGAVPKELLASELFGYEPGTFTGAVKGGRKGKFEEAHGGTIFLDEIGEMPLEFQVYLLRVLQEREIVRLGSSKPHRVDVNIIAATHHNLEKLVQEGLFRADFYYRLQVVSINIPPLRERRDDIPLIIDHFLAQFSQKHHKPLLKLDDQVSDFFINKYEWPGNVRELQNVLEHGVLFCMNEMIRADDLPRNIKKAIINHCLGSFFTNPSGSRNNDSRKSTVGTAGIAGTAGTAGTSDITDTADTESTDSSAKEALLRLIRESNGNISASARKLGVARSTLYRYLKKYDIKLNQIYR